MSPIRRAPVVCVAASCLSIGCVSSYDMQVKDPSEVEVRDQLTGTVIIPKGAPVARPAPPSNARRLTRRADGSLVLSCDGCDDDVVLSATGTVDARLRAVRIGATEVVGDAVLVHGSKRRSAVSVEIATPRANVVDVREREPSNEPIGYALVANGALWMTLAGVFFFAPGLKVGKGDERRPMTNNERAWLGGISTFIGVGFTAGGGALLVRGNPSTSVLDSGGGGR